MATVGSGARQRQNLFGLVVVEVAWRRLTALRCRACHVYRGAVLLGSSGRVLKDRADDLSVLVDRALGDALIVEARKESLDLSRRD